MKNIFIVFITVCICCMACNNTATNADKASMPAEEQQLRNAISQYPDSMLLTENLIQYFRDSSNFKQAIAETEKAIQKDSINARLWDIKGQLHFENSDTINAIKDFKKAFTIDAQPKYIISLGALYAQTKNISALAMADALLHNPNAKAEKQALFIEGLYYSYSSEYEKAIPFFDTCLTIDYTYTDAYKEKAKCLYHLAKYKEAIQSLNKAVALQSSFEEGYYWLGRCYEKLNQPQEAIMNYKAAVLIDPEYSEAKKALARVK